MKKGTVNLQSLFDGIDSDEQARMIEFSAWLIGVNPTEIKGRLQRWMKMGQPKAGEPFRTLKHISSCVVEIERKEIQERLTAKQAETAARENAKKAYDRAYRETHISTLNNSRKTEVNA